MARHWGCNKCAELFETMELAQACHPGADVIGPLRAQRVRVRQGTPGRLDVEPDPERDALEARVAELEAALAMLVRAIDNGVCEHGNSTMYPAHAVWCDDCWEPARALAPSAEKEGE